MDHIFSGDQSAVVSSNRILYTPSPFARSALLHLQEIGELKALKPHTSSRNKLASYLFFTVLDGAGELRYEGRKYDLGAGDCVFIDCQKPYSHTTEASLWTLRWCHFFGRPRRSSSRSMASAAASRSFTWRGRRTLFPHWTGSIPLPPARTTSGICASTRN